MSDAVTPERDEFFADLRIVWRPRTSIRPNDYNPNYMDRHKHEELLKSILHNGWTQPIVINEKDDVILDGEQRWTVAGWRPDADGFPPFPADVTPIPEHEPLVPDRADYVWIEGEVKEGHEVPVGYVPTTSLVKDEVGAKISTIQHNRASGEHGLDDISTILTDIMEFDELDFAQDQLGMEQEEIDRLVQRTPATAVGAGRDDTGDYSPTWEPHSETADEQEEGSGEVSATDSAGGEESPDPSGREPLERRVYVMSQQEVKIVDSALGDDAPANVLVSLCSYAMEMGWVPDQREFEQAIQERVDEVAGD